MDYTQLVITGADREDLEFVLRRISPMDIPYSERDRIRGAHATCAGFTGSVRLVCKPDGLWAILLLGSGVELSMADSVARGQQHRLQAGPEGRPELRVTTISVFRQDESWRALL